MSSPSLITSDKPRCWWCGEDPIYQKYHDEEWGVPLHDDRALFEMLILEGFQAGLSWLTILRKRENFRLAYKNFEPEIVASFTASDEARLMADPGIVRNRSKISASVINAKAFLQTKEEFGSFNNYIWRFTDGKQLKTTPRPSRSSIKATTELSDRISKDLKARGFKFVGSTIVYAHMQATGMVDDHVAGCFLAR